MSKNVAIFGSGPTGLLVAWAVEQAGHRPHIFAPFEKSVIPGSQHLHGPVPGLTSVYPEGNIQFIRLGTAQDYAMKVYGDPERNTGWENYLQVFPAWNVIAAYDKLWDHFVCRGVMPEGLFHRDEKVLLTKETISGMDGERLREIYFGHDLTISTIPAQALCHNNEHKFEGSPYWIKTLPTPPHDANHDIVVYNGLRSDHWYRWSILGGVCSIETASWAHADETWIAGTKAIGHNCNCWNAITRCGRWAEWRHGVTMYHAYQKAVKMMEDLNERA